MCRDYGLAISVAVVVAFLIRFFLLEAYRVPSTVMSPALMPGDTIFVFKSAYWLRLPGAEAPVMSLGEAKRGDVVIYTHPLEGGADFVRRVVGLPGDRVEVRNGTLYLNERTVRLVGAQDPDAQCDAEGFSGGLTYRVCSTGEPGLSIPPTLVPEGQIFVLGDDRSIVLNEPRRVISSLVSIKYLRGKVLWIWLSVEPGKHADRSWFSRIRFDRMFRRV